MERWKPIKNYEGIYWVSDKGRIKNRFDRILRPSISGAGYYHIVLAKHYKMVGKDIHRIVAEAFLPNPKHYPQINHKDENRLNNCVSNLEWCTAKYNVNYGHHKQRSSEAQSKGVFAIYPDGTDAFFSNQIEAAKFFNTTSNYFNHWVTGFRRNKYGIQFEVGGVNNG